jgi:hydroxyacylglutathione hydrolase
MSENGIDTVLFTGDILFIGDIGRPDLLGEENLEVLAAHSYSSSRKLWDMEEGIIVLPSHTQGSLCGKNLSKRTFSTIGIEKKANNSFALCQKEKVDYIDNLMEQKIETPHFFKKMAGMNIEGPILIEDLLKRVIAVDFDDVDDKVQIVDIRHPKEFHRGHIKNSINIYENANVSLIAGSILDYEKDIYLIGDNTNNFDLYMTKLFRVGGWIKLEGL